MCFCTFFGLSWSGVDGGDGVGVELVLSDDDDADDDELSDGNVASVQYEPSDSPSLERNKLLNVELKGNAQFV